MFRLFSDIESGIRRKIRINQRKRVFREKVETSDQVRIIIGAGITYYKGWISTNIEIFDVLKKKEWKRNISSARIDALLSEHVWEHFTLEQASLAASHCYDYLRPGAYLRVAVPDGYHPGVEYINAVRPGGTGGGAKDHKVLYTYDTLTDVFVGAGFHVELLEYFDENKNFHYKDWDQELGMIRRSSRYDERNKSNKYNYTSIILDAIK
jgi:predicted SAM-dependent methyltransferase